MCDWKCCWNFIIGTWFCCETNILILIKIKKILLLLLNIPCICYDGVSSSSVGFKCVLLWSMLFIYFTLFLYYLILLIVLLFIFELYINIFFKAPQHRFRVIIFAAKNGLPMPAPPTPTHESYQPHRDTSVINEFIPNIHLISFIFSIYFFLLFYFILIFRFFYIKNDLVLTSSIYCAS